MKHQTPFGHGEKMRRARKAGWELLYNLYNQDELFEYPTRDGRSRIGGRKFVIPELLMVTFEGKAHELQAWTHVIETGPGSIPTAVLTALEWDMRTSRHSILIAAIQDVGPLKVVWLRRMNAAMAGTQTISKLLAHELWGLTRKERP
jgi:hypothetical protein